MLAVIGVLCIVWGLSHLQWGGAGYGLAYCGSVNDANKQSAGKKEPPGIELPPSPAASTATESHFQGDCELSCSTAESLTSHEPLEILRKCKGEVRAQHCKLGLDLVGDHVDARLLLSDVQLTRFHVERSQVGGLLCLHCTLPASADALVLRSSTVHGSFVLRSPTLPEWIEDDWLNPRTFSEVHSGCDPKASPHGSRADSVGVPLVIDRTQFDGDVELQLLEFAKPIVLRDSSIAQSLRIDRAVFHGDVNFQGTRAKVISAAGTTFGGYARLFRTSAERDAWFECATFRGDVNMTGFETAGTLNLRRIDVASGGSHRTDTQAPVALDSVRAQGLDMTALQANSRVSLAGLSVDWLSLVNAKDTAPLVFEGGRIGRIIVYAKSWFEEHPDASPLTDNDAFPGYWTDGLESVSLGSIEPDEASSPDGKPEVGLRHVLQFLRNSGHSLGTYDVAERQYRENGKLLWASHVAFCGAAQKTSPWLGITGRVRQFAPEVPFFFALALLLMDYALLRRAGVRPKSTKFLAHARAFVRLATGAAPDPKELRIAQSRLLSSPLSALTSPSQPYDDVPSNLPEVERKCAVSLLEKRASPDALREALKSLERYYEAETIRSPLTLLAVASSSLLGLIDVGPSRRYEIADPRRRNQRTVIKVLWVVLIAWGASILESYVKG